MGSGYKLGSEQKGKFFLKKFGIVEFRVKPEEKAIELILDKLKLDKLDSKFCLGVIDKFEEIGAIQIGQLNCRLNQSCKQIVCKICLQGNFFDDSDVISSRHTIQTLSLKSKISSSVGFFIIDPMKTWVFRYRLYSSQF